jgi:hypothetical protein
VGPIAGREKLAELTQARGLEVTVENASNTLKALLT